MKLPIIVLVFVIVALCGGLGWLSSWDIPAPAALIERDISDEERYQ